MYLYICIICSGTYEHSRRASYREKSIKKYNVSRVFVDRSRFLVQTYDIEIYCNLTGSSCYGTINAHVPAFIIGRSQRAESKYD